MSDLHAQIMNIPCDRPDTSAMGKATAYKLGHRDARHAAAEMALSSATPTLSAAMQLPEVRALVGALCGLKRIIEEIDGAMDHGTWRDDKGQRLKDTPEWVAAYIALAPFTEAKP